MTNVVSFTQRHTARLKEQEDQKDRDNFKRLLGACTASEKAVVIEAVQSGDRKAYMEAIKPVCYRMALVEVNEKIREGEIELS